MSQLTTTSFTEIVHLIAAAKQRAIQAVNTSLIDLYWQVGEIISRKIASAEWGDGVVNQLADHIAQTQPGLRGFTKANLFRMRQFYETYKCDSMVSPLVTQLQPTALSEFKDAYMLEFLGLQGDHSESDLHQGLLAKLKAFLGELGRDFCFVGSQFPVQVGGRDFALDLRFFHRSLNCLVAIEPPRKPRHRRAAVRQQRRRSSRIRSKPHRVACVDSAV
jgi:predicted nuclease of restriction endonuclease-like (RecB) superfamily